MPKVVKPKATKPVATKATQEMMLKKLHSQRSISSFLSNKSDAPVQMTNSASSIRSSHHSRSLADRKKKCELHQATNNKFRYLDVYTDGACSNNQNRFRARAGMGAYFGDNDPRNMSEPFLLDNPTNIRAETWAAYQVLHKLVPRDVHVCLYIDCKYVIDSATKWRWNWEANNFVTASGSPVANLDLLLPLFQLIDSREGGVRFVHVKGHAGNRGNEEADLLAVEGAKKVPPHSQ